jgi:polynucleotide 5'-hydroxyl-kinase GRC3/NOL9
MKNIVVPQAWEDLVRRLNQNNEPKVIMVIGGMDTGKSTFSQFLFNRFTNQLNRTALIDADLGQSFIGPPATVGLSFSTDLQGMLHPLHLRFVGYKSPRGHMLQTLVAMKKMVDKAVELRAKHMVIDTSGFVTEAIGREFKFQMIDLISPSHVIALEKEDELTLLLRNVSKKNGLSVFRIKVPPEIVKTKSMGERKHYREERFREYFKSAERISLSIGEIGLHGVNSDLAQRQNMDHLLIGLCDDHHDTISLGIIQSVDLEKRLISFISPIKNIEKVQTIQFGSLYLNDQGQEL